MLANITLLYMELWSSVFLEEHDWATCSVSVDTWRRITAESPAARHIAEITYDDKKVYVALGVPHNVPYNEPISNTEKLYLPTWLLDHLGVDGCGQIVGVKWLIQENFPEASRIVLRPHDSAFYHADAKEELERALTRLGVVREGDTLVIPLECLGNYEIAFDVIKTEPANIVLAQGDEVVMEFEEALDTVAPTPRPDTPIPDIFDEIDPPPVVPVGETLGGASRIMPDGRKWNPWRDGPWTMG